MKVQGKKIDLSDIHLSKTDEKQHKVLSYMNNSTDGGYLSPQQVQSLMQSLRLNLQELMNYLVPYATKFAMSPISGFKVGAVAHGISGAIYFGANIEFQDQALSFTVHAEQASIAHAISYGETGIDYLAISAAPCGYCRQFLYEITNCPSTKDITILINNESNSLSNLLPQAFGPQDLGVTTRLMLAQNNNLQMIPVHADPFVIAAFNAANTSYSPYTCDYSGVCIATNYGAYVGSYAENAAYNPSMSPLEAAIVLLIMNGDSYNNIYRAILVEAKNNKCSQLSATKDILAVVAKDITLEYYSVNSKKNGNTLNTKEMV
jgi:cytidine deaminase